ncbi:RHS repeat-associated core domain-containing protein [Nocardioides speluncae]|uniref:RHS repeat-associated core domain-containing protein n=1 Tax=Nocardioides speluncae TaxID=2670337 RepID=UPI00137A7AB2|nr:RHS repeat-associated core domain-containing protein [Nocardioides speluncae]
MPSERGAAEAAKARQAWEQLQENGRRSLLAQETANRVGSKALEGERADEAMQGESSVTEDGDAAKPGGDYTATPLSASSSWTGGGSSGSFTWSYDFRMPPPAAGPVPSLGVHYDSGSVDGRTFASNNQPGPIGEGFSLTESYVERSFISCKAVGVEQKYDQCWRGERLRLVLNGNATDLIPVSANEFRLRANDGSKVTRLFDAENGDNNGEHWRLVTTDGTEYVFGMERLPGWTTGQPVTESVWTVPVFSRDGDPAQATACKKEPFAESWCQQAWRWNLDLVSDTSSNASTYWYVGEENRYARGGNPDHGTSYDRGGYLTRIDYGLRRGSLFDADGLAQAPQRVRLTYAERCLAADCSELNGTTKAKWPDVPYASICKPGDRCEDDPAPTFFSRKRLVSVTTGVDNGAGYRDVDEWTLDHIWFNPGEVSTGPGDVADQVLWPTVIQHKGVAGPTPIAKRAVKLMPTSDPMANRVDKTGDGIAPFLRPRLGSIVSETGGITTVDYSTRDCAHDDLPTSAATNTRRCFPVWWAAFGPDPKKDWFHKYVVAGVMEIDPTGNDEAVITHYKYGTTCTDGRTPPCGAAWRYDDNPMLPNAHRTWSQWRGYERVTTLRGNNASDTQSMSTTVYLRGMDGNRQADGSTKSEQVSGITASSITDRDEWAGRAREKVVYTGTINGSPGAQVSGTIWEPWTRDEEDLVSYTFPGGQIDGKDADPVTITAHMVRERGTTKRTRVTGTAGTYDRSTTQRVTDYDGYGMPVKTVSYATPNDDAPGTTTDHTCTLTWYARNPDKPEDNLVGLVARQQTLATSCADADQAPLPPDATEPKDVVSDQMFLYVEGATWNSQEPTKSLAVGVLRAKGYTGRAPIVHRLSTSVYDALGRPTAVTAKGATTTTKYTPEGAGVPTRVEVTNDLEQTITSVFDPAWGAIRATEDPNNNVTTQKFDALGRVTGVWLPDNSEINGHGASIKFAYHLGGAENPDGSVDGSWLATSRLKGDSADTYVTGYEIFDSLLRPRQTQAPSPAGGRVMTDTRYDDRGLAYMSFADIWDSQAPPSGTRFVAAEGGYVQTKTVFDGAERTIKNAVTYGVDTPSGGLAHRTVETTTSYTGDSTAVTPPTGGVGRRTVTDVWGRTVEERTYPSASPTGSSYLANKSDYNQHGRLAKFTGPDGKAWTYTHDLHGRVAQSTDPDRGTALTSYDAFDRVHSTMDAEEQVLSYGYDVLGRQVGKWKSTAQTDANKLAAWTYDDAIKGDGHPHSAVRYVGGAGTTGKAYTTTVTAYDELGRPVENSVKLPSTDPLVATKMVSSTLTYRTDFNTDGTVGADELPAIGKLPSEIVSYGYDAAGLGLPKTVTGKDAYALETAYTEFGDPSMATLAVSPNNDNRVWQRYYYDGLRRLERFDAISYLSPSSLLDQHYTYNDAGGLTSVFDKSLNDPDNQCFSYGDYNRLAEAWTPNVADCDPANRKTDQLGGSSPSWHSYTYNAASGTRATRVDNPTPTRSSKITTKYIDGAAGHPCYGTTDPVAPHALRQTSTTVLDDGVTTSENDFFCTNKVGDMTRSEAPDGTRQDLTWTSEGKLDTLTKQPKSDGTGGATYQHIYTADGDLLIKRPNGDGSTILYLPGGQELRVAMKAGKPTIVRGLRYYSHGAVGVIALRDVKASVAADLTVGTPTTKLYWLAADRHGSNLAQWDSANPKGTEKKRYLTPFGADRTTPGATFVDDKKFLGKPHDAGTGFTHVAAREYSPDLGRFLSVDPLLDPADPLSVNGYTYADQDPVNNSDPTGLECVDRCGGGSDPGDPDPDSSGSGNGGSGTGGSGTGGSGSGDDGSPDINDVVQTVATARQLNWAVCGGNPVCEYQYGTPDMWALSGGLQASGAADAMEAMAEDPYLRIAYILLLEDFGGCASNPGASGSCLLAATSLVGPGKASKVTKVDEVYDLIKHADDVPPRFITTGAGATIDRLAVNTSISAQRQGRHVLGAREYGGGSYFNSADDAQRVLDDFHSGAAQVLGLKGHDIVVRVPGVTGVNVNPRSGFPSQATNVFFIKGTRAPSVVPYNPAWTP